ncbi:MAG TPA: dihydrolipoamide acetyltransferase family protein [Acidimicrobiia bacterium]
MTHEFRLPDIGEGLTEAEIVRWLVPEGGRVEADQPVVEVETDKAVVEIPAPYAGIVIRHGGAEGETIAVGSVLVVIGEPSDTGPPQVEEVPEGTLTEPSATPPTIEESQPTQVAPIVGSISEEAELLSSRDRADDTVASDQVKALPIVRKLAREIGVDLTTIEGSGPDGRVTREDVLAAAARAEIGVSAVPSTSPEPAPEAAEAHPAPPQPGQQVTHDGGDERRPMTRLRRTIAANMARSWAEIPHVTTFDEVDATRLLEIRSALGARHDVKIPMEALVVKAVIPALQTFPEFNATLEGDELVVHGRYDIGIAVDATDGLMVTVIGDAAGLGVLELATEVRRLGEGARSRSLSPDELTGQTFTVSNIGAVGGGHGTPIVPYGTVAILSVGRAREKVIVADGDLAIAPVMPLSLSFDHRVIDGAQGRRFMSLVIENLEEPALFLAG